MSPSQLRTPVGAIVFWVIWDHPADYPHGYLLRAQWYEPGAGHGVSELAWHADDPEKLRAILPPGCVPFMRQDGDPPHLLETWMA